MNEGYDALPSACYGARSVYMGSDAIIAFVGSSGGVHNEHWKS